MNSKGILILVSDTVKDPIEAYKACFDRNEVEYAFNMYKQRLGGNRMRVATDSALTGKAFVQFIATSIAIMFRKRVNLATKTNKKISSISYDSDFVIISKLNTIKQLKFDLGSFFTEVVGGLKTLLESMNIPLPSDEVDDIGYEADLDALEQELEDCCVEDSGLKSVVDLLE